MSPKRPAVTARQVVKVARRLGFVFGRQRGSHAVYRRDSDGARLVISLHPGDIPTGTLHGIIEEMGITLEEFQALL